MNIQDKKEEIYDGINYTWIERPKEIINFFNEIEEVCKKYNISISHEDGHGNFELERYSEGLMDWLKSAVKRY